MTLAAYVIKDNGDSEPAIYCVQDGVNVGRAGELVLISSRNDLGLATEMQIYAPGTWREVNVQEEDD
jgi:hypothetical protein